MFLNVASKIPTLLLYRNVRFILNTKNNTYLGTLPNTESQDANYKIRTSIARVVNIICSFITHVGTCKEKTLHADPLASIVQLIIVLAG